MCDFHIFIDIFDDISTFHHFDHFFVNFFSCGVWGGCGGVAGLHRKVFVDFSKKSTPTVPFSLSVVQGCKVYNRR